MFYLCLCMCVFYFYLMYFQQIFVEILLSISNKMGGICMSNVVDGQMQNAGLKGSTNVALTVEKVIFLLCR